MSERLNDGLSHGLNYGGEPTVYPDQALVKGWTYGQDADVVLLRDRLRDLDHRTLERLDHGVDLLAGGGWTLYDSQRLSIVLREGLDSAVEDHPGLDRDAAGNCAAWAVFQQLQQDLEGRAHMVNPDAVCAVEMHLLRGYLGDRQREYADILRDPASDQQQSIDRMTDTLECGPTAVQGDVVMVQEELRRRPEGGH